MSLTKLQSQSIDTNITLNGVITATSFSGNPLIFETLGFELARITSDGKFGLGITNPSANTEIYYTSTAPSLNSSSGAGLALYGTSTLRINFGSDPSPPYGGWIQSTDNGGSAFPLCLNPLGGNVAIGATSPAQKLTVGDGTPTGVNYIRVHAAKSDALIGQSGGSAFGMGASTGTIFGSDAAFPMAVGTFQSQDLLFGTNNVERGRIDSSGRLLIGTSTARGNYYGSINPTGIQNESGYKTLFYNANNAVGSAIFMGKSRGTAALSNTIVQNNDDLGAIVFFGVDGTNAIPAVQILAEVDGTPGANDMPGRLVFSTTADGSSSPTERMRLDSSGRLGLGTTSPVGKLSVKVGDEDGNVTAWNSNYFLITSGDVATSHALGLGVNTAGNYSFLSSLQPGTAWKTLKYKAIDHIFEGANDAERARIDSSGRLLIGTSSALSSVGYTSKLQVQASSAGSAAVSIINTSNDAFSGGLIIHKSRNTSAVQQNDGLAQFRFAGYDGSGYVEGVRISAEVDGTPGANDMPGRIVLSTTADGSSSPTERVRIDSAGGTMFGGGGFGTQGSLSVRPNFATGLGTFIAPTPIIYWNRTSSTSVGTACLFQNTGVTVGSITYTNTATTYTTSSDYRLKENIVPLTGAVDRLKLIPVHRFNFIADPSKTVDGFLAHEAQAVVPECVTGTKDEVDDEGNPVYQGIDQSKLVPLLTAALQEALDEIESLKARLTAAGI